MESELWADWNPVFHYTSVVSINSHEHNNSACPGSYTLWYDSVRIMQITVINKNRMSKRAQSQIRWLLTAVCCPSNVGSRHFALTITSALNCSLRVSISPTLKNWTTISTLTWNNKDHYINSLKVSISPTLKNWTTIATLTWNNEDHYINSCVRYLF